MALPLRRLASLVVIAAAFGCPTAVNAPVVKVAAVGSGVQIGQVVRLDAGASTDPQGRDMTFAWQFTAMPIGSAATLNDAHSATPSFLADVDGEYDVQVVVSNAFVSAAAAKVVVTVSKCGGRAPVFGSNAVVAKDAARPTITNNFAVGATIVLSSDVSDPDNSTTDGVCSTAQNQAVSYSWKLIGQPAASAATLNNSTASSPSFVADVAGTYTVRLVATDSTGRSSVPFDQTFTVSTCGSNAPTITSVAPISEQAAVGKTVQLNAVTDDADNSATCQAVLGSLQTFSYRWSMPQLPNGSRAALNSTVAQNPSFTPDIDGPYTVRLVVVDSTGLSSAPKDTGITIPKCGNNAPVAQITSATGGAAPSAGFLGLLVQFGEVVQDADQQAVTIPGHIAPLACAQPIPQTFSLKWSILALPAGSTAQLNNPTGTNPSFTPDVAGVFTLQLVATDQSGLSSAPATQSVSVANCGLTPPVITSIDTFPVSGATTVNAGTAVGVKAVASDPDNSTGAGGCNLPAPQTLKYAWSLVSKPSGSAAFFTNPAQDPAAGPAVFTPDVPNGTYQVQVVVTDSTGLKSPAGFFSVFTNSCGSNAPVLSSASASVTGPDVGTAVTLTAAGSDPDNTGKCVPPLATPQGLSYQWTLVSRPSGSGAALSVVTTTPADGHVASFTPDVIGSYQFSALVTDSTGLSSAPSFVTVQTSLCGSHAPVITSATATSTPASPRPTLDAVSLSGTVTDADDACFGGLQPKTFAWTVVSRPAGSSAVIANSTSLTAASFTPDLPGAYQFRLDVTDSLGLKAAPAFASIVADSCSVAAPVVSPYTAGSATQFNSFTFPAPVVANPNCLPAAATNSFVWSINSAPAGSSATLSNPTDPAGMPSFTPDKVGSYQFALTVTNGAGISAAPVFFNVSAATCGTARLGWSSIAVTKVFDPDPATAGTTFTGGSIPANPSVGAQVTVSAAATDPNTQCHALVNPISYQWAIVAAPKGSHATLTSTTDPSPAFVPDVPNGAYQLSVVATDALGNTSSAPDFITVTSSSCGANVPSVTLSPVDLTGTNSIFSDVSQAISVTTTDADTDSCTNRFHIAPTAFTYAWSIATQPSNGHATLTSATGSSTSFLASVPGLYSVHVVSTAPNGISSDPNKGFLAINALSCGSNAPVVNSISTFVSGSTTSALSRPNVGQAVDLVANTTDADIGCGAPGAAVTSWTWTAVSLPSGSVAPSTFTAASGKFTLTPDVAGTFTYSVVATDNTGLRSAPVQVTINTASCAPAFGGIRASTAAAGFLTASSANAVSAVSGFAISLDVPPSVTHVTGAGSGTVSASGAPVAAHSYAVAISTAGATGTAQFTLSVDGGAASAAAATGASVPIGNGINLLFSGTFTTADTYSFATSAGSYVLDSCVKQPSYAYGWTLQKPSNSQATLSTLTGSAPQFTPDVPGTYALQLVITDNAALVSAPAVLTVNVANCGQVQPVIGALAAASLTSPPNAGQNVTLSAPVINDGNATTCGSLSTQPYVYNWSLISVPAGSSAKLSSQTAASPQFVADVPNGTYQVALTITDQLGMVSAPAFIGVTSSKCGANAPVLALTPAAAPLNANSPLAVTALATDADNACAGFSTTVTGISWSIVSAPAGSTSSLVSSATVPVSNGATPPSFNDSNTLQANAKGTYVVQGVATASNGLKSAPATATFAVAPTGCGTNAPVITQVSATDITAGSVSTSRPPVGHVVALTASHFDADESLSVCNPASAVPTYAWTLVSEPTGSAVTAPTGPQTNSISFTADRAGTFVWSVVATDPFGLKSAATTVTVATGTCGPTLANAPAAFKEPIGVSNGAVPSTENAGGGYSVTQGATLTLNTATPGDVCVSGGAAPTMQWSLTAVPAGSNAVLSGATGSSPSFTADLAGTYGVQLVITDNGGNASVFTTTIAAGACTSGPTLSSTLTGSAMESVGGVVGSTIFRGDVVKLALPLPSGISTPSACSSVLIYEWSMIGRPSGSQATLSSTSDATPSFSADVAGGAYQFALVVRDGLGNASAPFFFSLTTSGCGTFPPSFASGAIGFSASPRANAPISLTSPSATDGNASCPTGRGFQATPLSYAFSVATAPAGAQTSISQNGTTSASLVVNKGGDYTVQVIATDANGRSTAPLKTAVPGTSPAVSNCGAFPPVTNQFAISQNVPGTGTQPSDTPTTTATTTAGGAASSAKGFYFGFPISISTPAGGITDADFGAGCTAFAVPAQTVANSWSLVSAPAASRVSLGASNGGSVLFTPDVAGGPYTVSLTTTDNLGYSSTSTLSFSVNCGTNTPASLSPTATQPATGDPLTAMAVGSAVRLDASPVDADTVAAGACTVAESQPFTWQWSFTQVPPGSSAALLAPTTKNASFVPDVAGAYNLSLTVTDPQGHSATDTTLSVNAACGVVAPSVAMVGTSTARDFSATQDLTVNGGTALHIVRAGNHLLDAAGAGPTTTPFYPGVPVQLSANVPNPVPQGGTCAAQTDTITYKWSIAAQPAGSTASINNPAAVSPSFTPDLPGTYDFQLVLTDQNGRSSTTLLSVDDLGAHPGATGACGTRAPTAVANVTGPIPGPSPANEPLNVRAQLDAAGSQSPDDYRSTLASASPGFNAGLQSYPNGCGLSLSLSYAWNIRNAPAGATAALSSTTLSNPSFAPDVAGPYTAQLTVTDSLKNSASTSVTVNAVASFTSTPAATGAVFTATTTDASGNPIVAFWDNSTGTVAAEKCTANCNGPNPIWALVGGANIDSALTTMTMPTSLDEPRPVAAAFAAGNLYVAYYTSSTALSTTVTAGAHAMPACGVALAIYNGASWSWHPMTATPASATCTPSGSAATDSGRWLSVDATATQPAVSFSVRTGATQLDPHFRSCVDSACATINADSTVYTTTANIEFARWNRLHLDASGAVALALPWNNGNAPVMTPYYAFATSLASANLSGSFSFVALDSTAVGGPNVGPFINMATNAGGTARFFIFRDETNHTAKYARCALSGAGNCVITPGVVLPDASSTDYGRDGAVAYDVNGVVRVAYVDVANSKVRVLALDSSGNFNKTADFGATASPGGLSMAFGPAASPLLNLAYDAPTSPSLKFFVGP